MKQITQMYPELREELREVIQHWQSELEVGSVYKTKTLIKFELEKYNRKDDKIHPSDHCYNKTNQGNCKNIRPTDEHNFSTPDNIPLFECISRGIFKYLGENYPYNGICVLAGKKRINETTYGEWKDGTFFLSTEQSVNNDRKD